MITLFGSLVLAEFNKTVLRCSSVDNLQKLRYHENIKFTAVLQQLYLIIVHSQYVVVVVIIFKEMTKQWWNL